DLDIVLVLLVQVDRLGEVTQLTVDTRPDEAGASRLLEDVAMLAFARLHHRRGDHQPRPLGKPEHLVSDLLDALLADLPAAAWAMGMADARVQESQVVVDLGHRAGRGA